VDEAGIAATFERCRRPLGSIERAYDRVSRESSKKCVCARARFTVCVYERVTLASWLSSALQVLANRGGSARLRFMILDTLTLPCKDWEPRRKEPGPRPLDAMRLEAAHLLPGDDVNWMAVGPSVESSRSPEAPPGCSISDATYQFWAREHEGPMTGVARNAHGASEGSQRVRNPQSHNPMGCGTALWRGQRQDRTSEDADEWPALGAGASEHDSKERDGPASRTGPRRVRFGDGACGQQPDAPDAVF